MFRQGGLDREKHDRQQAVKRHHGDGVPRKTRSTEVEGGRKREGKRGRQREREREREKSSSKVALK